MSFQVDYVRQLEHLLHHQREWVPSAESGSTVQVELGAVLGRRLLEPDFRFSMPELPDSCRIIDRNGHGRPIYRPLLVYALTRANVLTNHKGEMESFNWPAENLPANLAEPAAIACWEALSLFVAKIDGARNTFDQLIARQQKSGSFLLARPSDSPDMRWYYELVMLHALGSYAAQSGDPSAMKAMRHNALFHLEESQPDHATNQPWGLFAFIWVAEARPLADQLLHTLQTQHPDGIGGIAAILVADALLCLRCVADRLQ
ncbi:MAG: hypothetical protein IT447_09455 [Phycisphaerales bacterium]|jgi:hypothetical protein|nr:hypothetical protein [Phycisphaerales bacterium]